MKVYKSIDDFKNSFLSTGNIKKPVVTTGTFDGVHLGHQKIIHRLKDVAKDIQGETVLLTFYPHPRMVLYPDDNDLKLINTQAEKIELLDRYGIDHLIIHPFTKDFSRLSSLEFVRNILVNNIFTKRLVIGYNHHFGRNREGSFEHLKEFGPVYGFEVEEIPAKDIDSIEISSTKIRTALLSGDMDTANNYLGHTFSITGTVVEGKKLGRTIGYPTANISVIDKYKIIPFDGVYAVYVSVKNKQYKGMLNIGENPTIPGKGRSIEVNIFDFNEDIYQQEATIYFIKRLRNELKFDGLEALTQQLAIDKIETLRVLEK